MFAAIKRKPALGPSFAYMTDATLWLSKFDSGTPDDGQARAPEDEGPTSIRVAEVLRSKLTVSFTPSHFFSISTDVEDKESKSWCSFRIRDGVLSGK